MLYKKSDIPLMDKLIANLPDFLADGYDEEVRAFTRSIQAKPQQVFLFERHFDALVFDNLIHWNGTPSQDATLAKVAASEEQMRQFLEGIGRPYESYLIVTNHGTEITFEVGWRDQMAGNVVWDRWIEAVDDPVMAFANAGFLFDLLDYQCATRPTEKPEPPLYRYHPERFKAYRDYAEIVGKFYRQKVEPQSGMLTVPQLNEVMRVVFTELNRRSMDYPRRLKESHPAPSLVIEAEETLATAYGRFVQAGRQIMDFPPALTEMLAKTDIDDIPLNSIKLPYASQYLYFGPQVALELEPGWFVDGAYVEQRGLSGDVGFYAGTPENSVIPHCERQSVCCLTCRASNSVGKCLPELPCPLYIVGMQVNRRGRNRRVTQVISYGAQLNPSGDRVGRMGVPHPVRRGPMQLFSQHRMVVLDNLRDEPKKPAHDFPQPQGLDAGIGVVKAANQGRGRIPVSTADRKPPLLQISVQRCAR